MAEEKSKTTLDKIESLIVDGNKEVVDRVEKRLDEVKNEIREEIGEAKNELKQEMRNMHASLKKEISVTADILDFRIKEVGKKVDEVKEKLDEHMRMPAHVV